MVLLALSTTKMWKKSVNHFLYYFRSFVTLVILYHFYLKIIAKSTQKMRYEFLHIFQKNILRKIISRAILMQMSNDGTSHSSCTVDLVKISISFLNGQHRLHSFKMAARFRRRICARCICFIYRVIFLQFYIELYRIMCLICHQNGLDSVCNLKMGAVWRIKNYFPCSFCTQNWWHVIVLSIFWYACFKIFSKTHRTKAIALERSNTYSVNTKLIISKL